MLVDRSAHAELLIEIGHLPAAELEALGWILGRPAGRLHDAIHGNHGADDNLPHGSLSLLKRGSSISAAGVHPAPSPGSRTGRTEFDSNQEILSQLLTLLLSVSAWPSRPLRVECAIERPLSETSRYGCRWPH